MSEGIDHTMRELLRRNKYLKSLRRLSKGYTPVYIEYDITFKPRWVDDIGNPYLAKIISRAEETYQKNLKSLATYIPIVKKINNNEFPFKIDWHNHHMPALDGFSLMWAALRAKSTFMEIGSGNSTLFAKAALIHENRSTKIISIDPAPRADIDSVCDEIYRKPLEDMDLSVFDELDAGDTLFVDNSHRSFMNSDVTTFMLDVLPRLKPGVLVGIHDIFLPFDYFESWSERGYNEQYLLGCYLLANPKYFDIQFSNYWISRNKMHYEPLKEIWDQLEVKIRDRMSSVFWGIKN
jgi:Methyltransferase domain